MFVFVARYVLPFLWFRLFPYPILCCCFPRWYFDIDGFLVEALYFSKGPVSETEAFPVVEVNILPGFPSVEGA